MSAQGHSMSILDNKDILERNAGVDRTVVAAYAGYKRLQRELKQLGVEVRPRYSLEPPLGSGRPRDQSLTARQPGDIRSHVATPQERHSR